MREREKERDRERERVGGERELRKIDLTERRNKGDMDGGRETVRQRES